MDAAGRFYFTSVREYPRTLRSVFAGDFDGQRVLRVRSVEGDIQPPREFADSVFDSSYITGLATVAGRMLILLDIEKLITGADMALVEERVL